jgi:cytochrome c551/c552
MNTECWETAVNSELEQFGWGKGNATCHSRHKTIGPSVQDIAAVYKAKKAEILWLFLKDDIKPLVDQVNTE